MKFKDLQKLLRPSVKNNTQFMHKSGKRSNLHDIVFFQKDRGRLFAYSISNPENIANKAFYYVRADITDYASSFQEASQLKESDDPHIVYTADGDVYSQIDFNAMDLIQALHDDTPVLVENMLCMIDSLGIDDEFQMFLSNASSFGPKTAERERLQWLSFSEYSSMTDGHTMLAFRSDSVANSVLNGWLVNRHVSEKLDTQLISVSLYSSSSDYSEKNETFIVFDGFASVKGDFVQYQVGAKAYYNSKYELYPDVKDVVIRKSKQNDPSFICNIPKSIATDAELSALMSKDVKADTNLTVIFAIEDGEVCASLKLKNFISSSRTESEESASAVGFKVANVLNPNAYSVAVCSMYLRRMLSVECGQDPEFVFFGSADPIIVNYSPEVFGLLMPKRDE
jgi:hypothetical protein